MAFDDSSLAEGSAGGVGYTNRPCVLPTADRAQTIPPLAASALAWAVPGAGHLLLGRRQKGFVFLLALRHVRHRAAACRAGCFRWDLPSRW